MYYAEEKDRDSFICQSTKCKAAQTTVKMLSKCPIQKFSCKWVTLSQDVINFYSRVEEGREQLLPKRAAPGHYPPEQSESAFASSHDENICFSGTLMVK